MSFNPAIPSRGDFLALSQKQLLSNFTSMYNAFLVDHVSLTAVDNAGMHNSITFRAQGGNPTTTPFQSAIYTKLISTVPQLFWRPNSDQTAIQLTNSNLNTLQTGAPSGDTQTSFIAGPFTVYFGILRNWPSGAPTGTVTLLPASTLLYVGLSTIIAHDPTLATTAAAVNVNANQFTVSYNNGSDGITSPPTIYYMAIGQ